ncbi:site-specific DNA-methyltransferase [uncultured Brachyspira sp.]|uniref:DNA-methyltransferase n=1 Tax=uncultured Brachyspira sp. TaxID=221953 RepID=UPI002626765C|nr:site-specific DNA-methyltransferase [uncultured Brachyspira sp.]
MELLFDLEDENAIEIKNKKNIEIKEGDLWQLGEHRLLCGDCTIKENINLLMNGNKADMVFTDPPYGMGKNILNDDLNIEDLVEFNNKWIPASFDILKDNGSWYCWGNDISILNIYSEILKTMIKNKKITLKNIIVWNKGDTRGQHSRNTRMYAVADEKCLFIMKGNQESSINAVNYDYRFESIREYLYNSRVAMGWDIATMKNIVGHSDKSRDHWTSKSQWNMPSREVYDKLQKEAFNQKKEKSLSNNAFCRSYDDLLKEYESKRAYFNNIHDNFNSVWNFKRLKGRTKLEDCGNHDTPKPVELCERAVKTSSRENELVLDLFLGSGSTLIACEHAKRICYGIEIEPYYCSIIIERWQRYTNKKAIKIN